MIIDRNAVTQEVPIDPETGKPTRVKIEERDGKKVRVAKSGKIVADSGSYKRESIKKLEGDEAE